MSEAKKIDRIGNIDGKEDRINIIRSITTVLSLYALVVLSAEGILLFIATKQSGTPQLILGILMAIILISALIIPVYNPDLFMNRNLPSTSEISSIIPRHRFDAFISVPMSALPDDNARKVYHDKVEKIVNSLKENTRLQQIYWAGDLIVLEKVFDLPDVAIRLNLNALRDSEYFILIYTNKAVTSSLVEAGMALALRKPCIFFVKDKEDLPFLLRRLEIARIKSDDGLPRVKIYDGNDLDHIPQIISINKQAIFE